MPHDIDSCILIIVWHTAPLHINVTVVMSAETTDHGDPYVNVMLQWTGQQLDTALTQNYTITVSPPTANHEAIFHTVNMSIQLALLYDQDYNISVVARSCFGSSAPAEISIRIINNCSHIRDDVFINYCLSSEINNIMTTADEIMTQKSIAINDSTSDGGSQQHGMCI